MGSFFAQSAIWLQLLTVGWLVRDLTVGSTLSSFLVVGIGGASLLPGLIAGPFGATLGDRFERRKVVMIIQGFMAILSLSFAFFAGAQLVTAWHVYIYAIIGGACNNVTQPIRMAMVPDTVPERLVGRAIATNMVTVPSTRMVGPFIGGLLIFTLGYFWNFALESFLYIGNILAFIFLTTPYYRAVSTDKKHSVIGDLIEGLSYIWNKNRVLLYLIFVALIPNALLEPAIFLFPVFASDVLRRGADVGGYLMAMSGFGGMCMGIVLIVAGFMLPKGKIVLLAAITSSLFVLLLAYSYILVLAFALIFLMSASQVYFRVTQITIVTTTALPEFRSRMTQLTLVTLSLTIVPSIGSGWLAGYTTVSFALLSLGLIGMLLGVFYYISQGRLKMIP